MTNERGTYSVFKSYVNNHNSNLTPTVLNETIQFGGDSKTYKELVYTSNVRKTLNLSIEVLTNDSTTSRLAERNRKKGIKVIPRPQNPWIIYRRDKHASPEFYGIKSCDASVIIGERWRTEDKEVLEYFIALSMLALENHQKKYGNYKFQPKQKISKMSKKSKNCQSKPRENVENISSEMMIPLMTFNQLAVIPPSPTNEFLPTPAPSIQHSPLTFQDEFLDQYLPTPASSNNQSPLTFQDEFLDQYLPTPASSLQDENLYPPSPTLPNQHMIITLEDLLSIEPIDPAVMYPQLSAITPKNDFSTYNDISPVTSENVAEFLFSANKLAALPSSHMTTTNTFTTNTFTTNTFMEEPIQDFDLYPAAEMTTNMEEPIQDFYSSPPPEMTTNMENQVYLPMMYDHVEYDSYDPFSINSYPDQLDHYNNLQ